MTQSTRLEHELTGIGHAPSIPVARQRRVSALRVTGTVGCHTAGGLRVGAI